jgi:hypothetical protein
MTTLRHGTDPRRPCFDVLPHEEVHPPRWEFLSSWFQARIERACLTTFGTHCLHLGDHSRYFCCTCGAGTDERRPDSLIWNRIPPADVEAALLAEAAEDERRAARRESTRSVWSTRRWRRWARWG